MFPFQLPNETTLYFGPNLTRCERNQNKFINLSYVKYRCKNLVTEVISTKKKKVIFLLFLKVKARCSNTLQNWKENLIKRM